MIVDEPGRAETASNKNIIYCALKFHLELSLLKSNSASVGVLSPEDTSASFLPEAGTTLGIIL